MFSNSSFFVICLHISDTFHFGHNSITQICSSKLQENLSTKLRILVGIGFTSSVLIALLAKYNSCKFRKDQKREVFFHINDIAYALSKPHTAARNSSRNNSKPLICMTYYQFPGCIMKTTANMSAAHTFFFLPQNQYENDPFDLGKCTLPYTVQNSSKPFFLSFQINFSDIIHSLLVLQLKSKLIAGVFQEFLPFYRGFSVGESLHGK